MGGSSREDKGASSVTLKWNKPSLNRQEFKEVIPLNLHQVQIAVVKVEQVCRQSFV